MFTRALAGLEPIVSGEVKQTTMIDCNGRYWSEFMKRQIHKFTTWSIFLLVFFGLVSGSQGRVLCVGPSEHVQVESACQSCCPEAEEKCGIASAAVDHSGHEGCSGCKDIALSHEAHRRASSMVEDGLHTYSVDVVPLAAISDGVSKTQPFPHDVGSGSEPDAPALISVQLASTVIRC